MLCRHALYLAMCCVFLASAESAAAQQAPLPTCPVANSMICVLPGVYGSAGLQKGGALTTPQTLSPHSGGHFESSFISNLTPLNTAIGSQLTLLPIASPSSGIVFSFDRALGVVTESTQDLGPILTDRANTVGRHKLYLGFSFQHFGFDSLDGASLNSLPAVFTHIDDLAPDRTGNNVPTANCSISGNPGTSSTGPCGFVRDSISTRTNIDLSLNQFTTYVTFGLTRRIDVSLAVPITNVQMTVTSDATILNNSNSLDHQFKGTNCPLPIGSAIPADSPCFHQTFSNAKDATGIGDLVLRVKGTVWHAERAAVALGADFRMPTGDELNFLGSGTYGFKPFVLASYSARISPHVNLGYEVNGDSTLAGDIVAPEGTTPSTLTKGHLPNQFIYAGGVDIMLVKKRLAATFDVIGQRVIDAKRASIVSQQFLGACGPTGLTPSIGLSTIPDPLYCSAPSAPVPAQTLTQTRSSFNETNAAVGAKFRAVGRLIIVGNVLIKLDDGGLRAKVAPLVGVSYTF